MNPECSCSFHSLILSIAWLSLHSNSNYHYQWLWWNVSSHNSTKWSWEVGEGTDEESSSIRSWQRSSQAFCQGERRGCGKTKIQKSKQGGFAELKKAKQNLAKLEERSKLKRGILQKDGKMDYAKDFFARQAFFTVSGHSPSWNPCHVLLVVSIHLCQLFEQNIHTLPGIWQNSGWWNLK